MSKLDRLASRDGLAPAPVSIQVARQLDQERIQSLTHELEELRNENVRMKEAAIKSEEEAKEIVLYFQRELDLKDKLISQLNGELRLKDEQHRQSMDSQKDQYEAKLLAAAAAAEDTEITMKGRIRVLENELIQVDDFRRDKTKLEEKLREVTTKFEEAETTYQKALDETDRRYLLDRAEFLRGMEAKEQEIRENARKEAQLGLGMDTKKIMLDNRRMREELRFQSEMTQDLNTTNRKLQEQLNASQREVALLKEQEKEFAQLGQAKNKHIKELREQSETLQTQLKTATQQRQKQRQELRDLVTKEIEMQSMDAAGLRRLLQLKDQELKKVRGLAQMVLDQRTETERYFLDALEEVKAKIRAERAANNESPSFRMAKRTFPQLPPGKLQFIGEDPRSSALQKDSAGKVHLRDLTLQDRELVLRLLFSKMNRETREQERSRSRGPSREAAASRGFMTEESQTGFPAFDQQTSLQYSRLSLSSPGMA